jgi:ABC-2 type transport system ATP-binding protein
LSPYRFSRQAETAILTTHRLEEAERLCDRVAILDTSLRTIGRPEELLNRLFTKTLVIRTAAPLRSPEQVFAVDGVEGWRVSKLLDGERLLTGPRARRATHASA